MLKTYTYPIICAITLIICATWKWNYSDQLLLAMLLFLPLLDSQRLPILLNFSRLQALAWILFVALSVSLLTQANYDPRLIVTTVIFTAVPEEWFFRGYLLNRIGNHWRGNLITSLLFSLLHALTRSALLGVAVFIPSLLFGYLYQKSNDLILTILVHAMANLIYSALLYRWFDYLFSG